MAEVEVKPCPFCGNTDFEFTAKTAFDELLLENYRDDPHNAPAMRLSCNICKTSMWDFDKSRDYDKRKAAVIEKWNRRAYE